MGRTRRCRIDRKSTRLNSSHVRISYAVFCLKNNSQHAISVLASLGYHDFEGPALRDDEKPRLVADLGDKTSLVLRNHGLLTVGETVAEAFVAMYYLETSCAIQVRAQSGGGELIPVPKEIIESAYAHLMAATGRRVSRGLLVWPGLLPRLDRLDPSYPA